ncbi:Conserved protein of unknown function [Mycobacterium canettii CIPT 140070010]|nr:Conserved protein of unknown function [Mycobacterium canettii CIPT 140070010]
MHIDVSDHQPTWHVATGDRRARLAPGIEELGLTLVEAVRRRDGLPRITQAVAVAATRNYGVPDNETDLLRHRVAGIRMSGAGGIPRSQHHHGGPGQDRRRMLLACSGVHRHGRCNSLTRVTSTPPPTTGQWTPTYPPAPPRSRNALAIAVASVAALLGAAALVVALIALTRPTASGPATTVGTTAAPRYTVEETAAAHQKLCEVYKRAARSVQIDTHGDSPALSRVSTVNGALMLEQAVNSAPALAPADRAAALTLAEAYTSATSAASSAHRDDREWQAVMDDVNAKDAQMKAVCSGS